VLTCIYDHATHLSSQTPPLFPPIPPLPYLILHLIFLFFWILFIATQLEASTPVCMFDPTSSFQDTFTWITASTRQYCEWRFVVLVQQIRLPTTDREFIFENHKTDFSIFKSPLGALNLDWAWSPRGTILQQNTKYHHQPNYKLHITHKSFPC